MSNSSSGVFDSNQTHDYFFVISKRIDLTVQCAFLDPVPPVLGARHGGQLGRRGDLDLDNHSERRRLDIGLGWQLDSDELKRREQHAD